jgi:hypothetical protein
MIDIDEFTINDNCSILERGVYNNIYICNCSNNWLFNLTTKINTINNYNVIFNFNYTSIETPSDTTTPQSSGGSGGGLPPNCINWSKCVNNKTIRLCQKGNSIYNQTKSCISNTTAIFINTTKTQEIKKEPIQEVVTEPEIIAQETPEVKETKSSKTNIILGVIVIIVLLGGAGILIYFVSKDPSNL